MPHGLIPAISTPCLPRLKTMVAALDIEFLTATLSEKGIALVRPGNRFIAPAQARQVFDVSGAGDTVIAVLALCLATGLKPENAVQLANLAAGIVVGKVGTVPVEKHELLAALSPQMALHAEDRVLNAQRTGAARRAVEGQWRTSRLHQRLLRPAAHRPHHAAGTGSPLWRPAHRRHQQRRLGERPQGAQLAPSSVRRERARVLAALAAVDAVVIFDEPHSAGTRSSPCSPTSLSRAETTTPRTSWARAKLQSWGGDVKIVPLVEGFSTTRLIEKGAGR